MSRQSTTSLPLLDVRVQTIYTDDSGPVRRTRTVIIEVPWGELVIARPDLNRYFFRFYWLSWQFWGASLIRHDSEGMREQYLAARKRRKVKA